MRMRMRMQIRDPGIFSTLDPGSRINILGPQHWIDVPAFFQKAEVLQPDVKDDTGTKEEDGDERKNGAGKSEMILRHPFLSRKEYKKMSSSS